MATDTEVRDWLRGMGEEVSNRGPLSKAAHARYELAHGSDPEPTDDDFGPEPEDSDVFIAEAAPPPADREVRPRSIATPKTPRLPWRKDKPQQGKRGQAKPKHKRVPLDDILATGWRFLGSLAKPLPATSRLLKIQAPVAGKILEPVLRDTIADRILQPLARTTEGAEAVAVLLLPPAVITAMQLQPQTIPLLMPVLRETLMRMVRIAGPAMAESMKQERAFEEQFGGSVDDLIALLLSDLVIPEDIPEEQRAAAAEAAEAEVVRRAQEAMSATVAA